MQSTAAPRMHLVIVFANPDHRGVGLGRARAVSWLAGQVRRTARGLSLWRSCELYRWLSGQLWPVIKVRM